MPYQVPGLLDDDESLLPSAGLLSAFQAPDPSQSALQQMAAQPAAQPPSPVAGGAAPAAAAAAPKQEPPKEVLSPTRNAIVAGGLQLLEDSSRPTAAPMTVGQMVASALRAGIPTLVASRQAKQSRADELSRQEQFKQMVVSAMKDGTLSPEQARQASQMGADAGIKYLENLSMEDVKSKNAIALETARQGDSKVVGKALIDPKTGKPIYRDQDPSLTVDGNVYQLGADGLPAKGADGAVLPPIIKKDTPFDINKIDAETRGAIQVALKRDPRDAEAFGAPLSEEDVQKVTAYNLQQRATSAPKSSTTIMNDTSAAESVKGAMSALNTQRDEATAARKDIQATTRALATLTRGFPTGVKGKFVQSAPTIARLIGIGGVDDAKIYMTQIADRVLPIVRQLAPVTEEDVKLLNMVKGGDISMSADGLKRLLELGNQANEILIDDYNERARSSKALNDNIRPDYIISYPKGYTPRSAAANDPVAAAIAKARGGG